MLSDHSDLVRMRDGVRRLRDLSPAPGVRRDRHRVDYGAADVDGRAVIDASSMTAVRRSATPSTPAAPAAWARRTMRARSSTPTAA